MNYYITAYLASLLKTNEGIACSNAMSREEPWEPIREVPWLSSHRAMVGRDLTLGWILLRGCESSSHLIIVPLLLLTAALSGNGWCLDVFGCTPRSQSLTPVRNCQVIAGLHVHDFPLTWRPSQHICHLPFTTTSPPYRHHNLIIDRSNKARRLPTTG